VLRGATDPGQTKKNSLEKVVELRTGAVRDVSFTFQQSCGIVLPPFSVAGFENI